VAVVEQELLNLQGH